MKRLLLATTILAAMSGNASAAAMSGSTPGNDIADDWIQVQSVRMKDTNRVAVCPHDAELTTVLATSVCEKNGKRVRFVTPVEYLAARCPGAKPVFVHPLYGAHSGAETGVVIGFKLPGSLKVANSAVRREAGVSCK